jgi:amino acid transporter
MATAVVVGTVIGSGVFKKPHAVAKAVEPFGPAMLAWVLVGVLVVLGALAVAENAVLFPRAGGNYVFLREAYGRPFGFLWGWVDFWIIRTGSIAALATIFAESLCDVLEATSLPAGQTIAYWPRQFLTVGVILALAAVNIRGVRWGGLLQLAVTLVKVGSLVAIAVLPFVARYLVGPSAPPPQWENLSSAGARPWAPDWAGLSALGGAMVGVLWAYHGWMNGPLIAGEVTRPQRNLPIAFLAGVGIIMTLYLSANLAYFLEIAPKDLAKKELFENSSVAAEFGRRLLGPVGMVLASAAVMVSVFGALNGNILVGPRTLYAMADDRLAPRALAAVHPRYHTPALATAVMVAWSALMILIVAAVRAYPLPVLRWEAVGLTLDPNLPPDKAPFDVITDFCMFGAVAFETLGVLSIFVFRRKFPDAPRPYRCPGYPVVPAVYGLFMAAVLVNMFVTQRTEALTGVGFVAMGVAVYAAFVRRGV